MTSSTSWSARSLSDPASAAQRPHGRRSACATLSASGHVSASASWKAATTSAAPDRGNRRLPPIACPMRCDAAPHRRSHRCRRRRAVNHEMRRRRLIGSHQHLPESLAWLRRARGRTSMGVVVATLVVVAPPNGSDHQGPADHTPGARRALERPAPRSGPARRRTTKPSRAVPSVVLQGAEQSRG